MTCIMVVDDSRVDQMLVASLLQRTTDVNVSLADNGRIALNRISYDPPDLVVTDLIMPEMDGLELLKQMRDWFPDIPVVLMTAYGNESVAVEALETGAASYVPKALKAELLLETVERVLVRAEQERHRTRVPQCVTELHCTYSLDNDPVFITPLIDEIEQRLADISFVDVNERVRTAVALEEALRNSIYHGNLEINEEDIVHSRSSGLSDSLATIAEARRRMPEYRHRNIRIEAHVTAEGARFTIHDDGSGFDASAALMRTKGECFESGRGRGLMLMQSLMDVVSFNRIGNEVTLMKYSA